MDRVIKSDKIGLHQFACVRAYLQGLEPLVSVRRYLLDDDDTTSAESALDTLAALMRKMVDAATARKAEMGSADQEAALIRSADAVARAAQATQDLLAQIRADRHRKYKELVHKLEQQARALGLQYVRRAKLPSPPDHLRDLVAFDAWYDKTHRPEEAPDDLELRSLLQEHLSDWYAQNGFHVPADMSHFRHANSEVVPMGALQIADAPRPVGIDPLVRNAASKHLEPLVHVVNRRPQASDLVRAWIGGTTLAALTRSDVFSLHTLGQIIKQHGANWHHQIPKLGPVRAQRLQLWLLEMEIPHLYLDAQALLPVQQRRSQEVVNFRASHTVPPALLELGLEPLAPYLENDQLNGRHGEFRNQGPNLLKAEHDLDALVVTLGKYKDKPQTLTVYARELCRFCLWAYEFKALPLSSLGVDEARQYREFLQNIPPEWISAQKDAPPRGTSDWRPFRGPLHGTSQRKALTSINVILGQMMNGGYLVGNPMSGVLKNANLAKPKMDVMRSFSAQQWDLIVQTMAEEAPSPASRRTQALMHLLYATGMRRDELFNARLSDIEQERIDGENALLLTVLGKGSKPRKVFIPPEVMQLVNEHLADRVGLFEDKFSTREGRALIPLISVIQAPLPSYAAVDGATGVQLMVRAIASPSGALSPDAMRLALKRLLAKCKNRAMELGLDDVEAFDLASLHWMRHTFGHTMADAQVDLRVLQKAMGHTNINTTAHYSKAELQQMVRGLRQGRVVAASPGMQAISAGPEKPVISSD